MAEYPAIFDAGPNRVHMDLQWILWVAWTSFRKDHRHTLDPFLARLEGTSTLGMHPDLERRLAVRLSILGCEMVEDVEDAAAPTKSRLRVCDVRRHRVEVREIRDEVRAAIRAWLLDPSEENALECARLDGSERGHRTHHQHAAEVVHGESLEAHIPMHAYLRIPADPDRQTTIDQPAARAMLSAVFDEFDRFVDRYGAHPLIDPVAAAQVEIDPEDFVPASGMDDYANEVFWGMMSMGGPDIHVIDPDDPGLVEHF